MSIMNVLNLKFVMFFILCKINKFEFLLIVQCLDYSERNTSVQVLVSRVKRLLLLNEVILKYVRELVSFIGCGVEIHAIRIGTFNLL
jgi:hypothetical protein